MELKEMIDRRKSTRSYTDQPVDGETMGKILDFSRSLTPLYPDIRVQAEILGRESVRCILPWITPQVLAIFTEETDGALENVGFLYQQVDLYIQSLGLGSCWLGMGRLNTKGGGDWTHNGLKFAIMIAFGYPKGDPHRERGAFKRKGPAEIADRADERLEPARLAPSSVNSQPWYFIHDGESIHAYCTLSGLFKKKAPSSMNLIDMGISLAHLWVACPETFRFFRVESPPARKDYHYIGSFVL